MTPRSRAENAKSSNRRCSPSQRRSRVIGWRVDSFSIKQRRLTILAPGGDGFFVCRQDLLRAASGAEIFQKLAETYERAFKNAEYQARLEESGQALSTSFNTPEDATKQFIELVNNAVSYKKKYAPE